MGLQNIDKSVFQHYLPMFVNEQSESLSIDWSEQQSLEEESKHPCPSHGSILSDNNSDSEGEVIFNGPGYKNGPKIKAKLTNCFLQAKKSIKIWWYTIGNDILTSKWSLEIFQNLVSNGVKIHIITDKNQAKISKLNKNLEKLQKVGAEVRINPKSNITMHHKFVIIDDTLMYAGSMNLGAKSLQNYEQLEFTSKKNKIKPYLKRFDELMNETKILDIPNLINE